MGHFAGKHRRRKQLVTLVKNEETKKQQKNNNDHSPTPQMNNIHNKAERKNLETTETQIN